MKEKLLILDDESYILSSLEHLFEDDYEVFTTKDSDVALQLAGEHDIAVILCDERMPKISGHEFFQRVKQVSRGTRVMISGYADMGALAEAVNLGQIFGYAAKPWEPLQLKAQVGAAMSHFKLVQEIGQERELLRALMESVPDLIYFKDRQSRFTKVNQAYAHKLGEKDAAECVGKSDSKYFGSEPALRWRLEEEEIVKSGRPQSDRIEHLKSPGGELGWWSTTKVPMFDRNGRVSGIAGISRNVTALKNVEEMLRQQCERSRMIIESAHEAFVGMDPDGYITAWNPHAELTFGWTAAEVMGRRFGDTVIAPRDRKAHEYGLKDFMSNARQSPPNDAFFNRTVERIAVHRDGREFPIEATAWLVRVGGECTINALMRDITERRREEEARRKEITLVQLLQSVTVAANRSSTIEETAHACLEQICSFTGWPVGHALLRADNSPEAPISRGIWHLDEPGAFRAFRETSDAHIFTPGVGLPGRVLASGQAEWIVDLADSEFFARARPAGEVGLRSGVAFPVFVEEKIMGVLEFFSRQIEQPDAELLTIMGHIGSQLGHVIVRQRGEQDLRQAKATAESANRSKSDFLATMSHEMRTPMNAILGMADLLSETPLREDQRDYVRIFQKAGSSLLDLINDILDLSKVESGYLQLESIAFDLETLLKKPVEMLSARAQERGLQLALQISPGVPLQLMGDPQRLQQILLNLLGNALKFTEYGSITLRVESDTARSKEGSLDWLRFSVIDTGIGISPEKTEMIFGRFNQADSSVTRKHGGTGLGLAISKGLVELMGGRIGCTSEVGKGSTFFFAVPFTVPTEPEAARIIEPAAAPMPLEKVTALQQVQRILIVEDSEDNLALIKAYLKDSAFQLDVAENGSIAVEKVTSRPPGFAPPDLVLMDLQMPVMDGLEATRMIRQWERETHARPLPILALTAHAVGEGAAESRMAGCNDHLTKPIRKSTLLDAIGRYLGASVRIALPDGVGNLVPQYLANVRRNLSEILAGGESKDWSIARRLGHQLKGSGEGYGFPEITRAGSAIEVAADASDEAEIRSQILTLSAILDRIEVAV